jgi:acyl-CoA synthetase (AMP-forming)/AMP-acid ligase II
MTTGERSTQGPDGNIVRSVFPDVDIPDVPLHRFVFEGVATWGDRPALIDAPSGRTLTYNALAAGVQRVAAGLAQRGLQKGDVFVIYSPNLPEYALGFYGAIAAGGVCSTVNPLYTVDELTFQLSDTKAKFLLTIPPFLDKAKEAAAASGGVQEIFVLGEGEGATPAAALLASEGDPPAVDWYPDADIAVLPYSSGTTGMPKGVMLSHRNLVGNVTQSQAVLPSEEHDVLLAVLPFFHIYGLTVLLTSALRLGQTLVTMPRFDLQQWLDTHVKYGVTVDFVVPPILLAMAKHPLIDAFDLSKVRYVFSGAAPASPELEEAVSKRLDCLVGQGYGLTETSPVLTANSDDPTTIRHGSCGRLLPNTEAKVVDPDTREAQDPGKVGELCFRGPQIMKGYLNRPDATADMIDADGWLYTGDLGYFDADGYLYVTDRVKELIKYKGMQVAPAELEALLITHPAITDAAVVRYPDEEAGEVPKAFIVRRGDDSPSEDEVKAWVAERVSPHKRVRHVEFIDAIPKSASGKILRRLLIDRDAGADAG